MGFAVLHIEKGTAGKAGGLGSHIDRTKKVLNADPKLSEKNMFYHLGENGKVYVYDNFKNRRSLQERINRRIQEGYILFIKATLLAYDLDAVLKGCGHQHGNVVGVVTQQVIGQTAFDNAALSLAQVQNHLAHLLEQLVRVRARVVAVGQKRHVLHSQTLVIGGHLIE